MTVQRKRPPPCRCLVIKRGWRLLGNLTLLGVRARNAHPSCPHFRVSLKYLKSGGRWPFLAGISRPSPLTM